jgi:predicted acyltransferase
MLLRIREDRVNDGRQRLESIDEFRGFSILLMVLADYLAGPHVVPAWLKHAPDIGFTVIDIIALLITLGASSLVFWCFHAFDERLGRSIPILREWGRNSLLLYVMHGVLLGVFVMP